MTVQPQPNTEVSEPKWHSTGAVAPVVVYVSPLGYGTTLAQRTDHYGDVDLLVQFPHVGAIWVQSALAKIQPGAAT